MAIINKLSGNLKDEMAKKVIKASNTNGLKARILTIIYDEQGKGRTKFNKYETLNALNSIHRTKFYTRPKRGVMPVQAYKYRSYRQVRDGNEYELYDIEYLCANLILTIKE